MEHLETSEVILGVDTHLDVHVGVVIDAAGRVMGTLSVGTNQEGYQQLLCWAQAFGVLRRAGVEGTGSYGAALKQVLQGSGVTVIEINRPDRSRRRGRGKSDVTDAESAARSVLAGSVTSIPKAHNGLAEALRTLSLVRRSAVKAKTQTINQIRALLVSAPQAIRDSAYKAEASQCVAACAALAHDTLSAALASLQAALRFLAKRWTMLNDELHELNATLARLTKKAAPRLLSRFGVGPQTAAILLVTAGDNRPGCIARRHWPLFAAPVHCRHHQARSSVIGLNRGGNRQANNALWTIAMVRMRSDARTRQYVARRTGEGLSKKEIHRCLKRYIVRELYPLILADLHDSESSA